MDRERNPNNTLTVIKLLKRTLKLHRGRGDVEVGREDRSENKGRSSKGNAKLDA